MTPAMLAGVLAGADHQVIGRELAIRAEEIDHVLPWCCPANHHIGDPGPAHLDESLEVKRVERLTELVEHEVGHVHHVVDRPQPHGAEALAQPPWRGPDDDTLDHPSRESWAPAGVLDPDLGAQLRGCCREQLVGDGGRRLVQPLAQRGCELASDADVAEAVGAVGGDVEIEDRVHREHVGERLSGDPVVEDEDAVGVLPHTELDRGAEHPWRLVPADGADSEPLVHRRWAGSRRCIRHEIARFDVGRPGHDPDGSRLDAERRQRRRHLPAEVQIRELEMRRPGYRRDRRDPGDDDPFATDLDRAHLGTGVDQGFDERLHGGVKRGVVAQPAQRELH